MISLDLQFVDDFFFKWTFDETHLFGMTFKRDAWNFFFFFYIDF